MANLTKVEIENLAGRKTLLKLQLNADVNVFWGPNGCGKTSLLKIIHSALWNQAVELARVPFKKATLEFFDNRDGQSFTRKLHKYNSLGAGANVAGISDDELATDVAERLNSDLLGEEVEKLKWTTTPHLRRGIPEFPHTYLPTSRIASSRLPQDRFRAGPGSRPERIDMQDEAAFDRMFAEAIRRIWSMYSHRELVKISEIQERGIIDILRAVIEREDFQNLGGQVLDSTRVAKAVTGFFQSGRFKISPDTLEKLLDNYSHDPVLQRVVAQITEIHRESETAQEPTRKIQELLQDLFTGNKTVEFNQRRLSVRSGTTPIALEYLSSGEKQIMRLLLECLAAGNNPVIVDEPEISLHPDWQLRLIESMRLVNPQAQLIVATHSPEVMARLDDSKVFEL
ncbi:hypothetical protein KALB_870 [Kutzneria albida DSM 43870]|uniref:ATPase AAA-type core domain-containing protein n=1 Tax=Kutzneria albida DSM 43870 TaxID=1449976 RepID=W5W7Q2_9PSEU|nr:ATP-binding protein [Kutzneria albida]AHH94244.1 hypothetical protein KALB_870 [Kutzneria albida DSM 43870]